MKQVTVFDELKKAMMNSPKELCVMGLIGTVIETAVALSDEYKQAMKEQHPDWYKQES